MATEETTTPRTDLDFEYFRGRLMEEKALAEQTLHGTEVKGGDDRSGNPRNR